MICLVVEVGITIMLMRMKMTWLDVFEDGGADGCNKGDGDDHDKGNNKIYTVGSDPCHEIDENKDDDDIVEDGARDFVVVVIVNNDDDNDDVEEDVTRIVVVVVVE
jgi:hypothetical protein